MRDSLWNFNRFSLGKPCQKRILSKRQLLRLIDLNMNPSPQDGFIVAQDRSFLKPRWSGKSGTSQIVSFEHAKASAALSGFVQVLLEEIAIDFLHARLWLASVWPTIQKPSLA